jgi:hypothetical protein
VIELAVYFILGFATAGLLLLAILPAFWRRAYRLSQERVEATLPISPAEIAAGRDQLRAGFAIDLRRAEQKVEAAGRDMQQEQALSGERLAAIAARDSEIIERKAAHAALERTLAATEGALAETRDALDAKTAAHAALSTMHDALGKARDELVDELGAATALSDERRVSIAALSTRVEAKNAEAQELSRGLAEAKADGLARRKDIAELERALNDARVDADRLAFRLNEATALADRRAAHIQEREDERDAALARIAALEADVAETSTASEALRHDLATERAGVAGIRGEALRTARDLGRTVETLKGDLASEGEIRLKAEAEAARLKREMHALKRAEKAAAPRRAPPRPAEKAPREERGSIAERIRDLQKELPPG